VAAFCNIVLTFPLNKLISRQSYEGLSARESFDTMRADAAARGARAAWRGVLPPLLQRTVAMGTMYGVYDFSFAQLNAAWTGAEGDGRLATDTPAFWGVKAAAAVVAGSVEALLTPFDRVQTVLQHRHYTEVFSSGADVTRALARHGAKEFYRGFTATVARNAPANALFFTLRDPARDLLPVQPPALWWGARARAGDGARAGGGAAGEGAAAGAGAGARADASVGAGASAAESPRAGSGGAGGGGGGGRGGGGPRDGGGGAPAPAPSPAPASWRVTRDFVSGAVLGAAISTAVYPLTTAKNVMQLDIGSYHKTLPEALAQVVREREGVRGLYRGAGGNAVRALLSWGVTNSAYELAKGSLRFE